MGRSYRSSRKGAEQFEMTPPLSPYLFVIVMQILTFLRRSTGDVLFHLTWLYLTWLLSGFLLFSFLVCRRLYSCYSWSLERSAGSQSSSLSFHFLYGAKYQPSEVFYLLFYSKWASPAFRNSVSSQLGINSGVFPFKYLGAAVSDSRLRTRDQVPLIEKLTLRLEGW